MGIEEEIDNSQYIGWRQNPIAVGVVEKEWEIVNVGCTGRGSRRADGSGRGRAADARSDEGKVRCRLRLHFDCASRRGMGRRRDQGLEPIPESPMGEPKADR